jgi:protein-S-isoprenylcysteine O-methyltransferase Ste14
MKRIGFFIYGATAHIAFLVLYAYMAAFTGDLVPRGIDAGVTTFSSWALAVDVFLVAAFGVQHSVMARPGFKAWWTRFVPQEIERSTYVWVSNLVFAGLMWAWQPLGPTIWHVESATGRTLLWGLFAVGWLMVPLVSLSISHFDLFGTRQVWLYLRGRPYTHLPFGTPGVYRFVRHPLYVGWLIAFWAIPTMSLGHFALAALLTLYIFTAIPFEERDLVALFGDRYGSYRERVPALVPLVAPAARHSRRSDSRT